MLGELIVTPNSPFWRAIALTILAAVGAVAILWTGQRKTAEEAASA
jgi:hypothetical protein